ncbi:MAG: hypothetical protein HY985_11525 [Magnetospirillum sp.]|nr:hypothetical protein [Magnetospirillum sp.]
MTGDRFIYDEKEMLVRDQMTGAVLRIGSRPADPIWAIPVRYTNKLIDLVVSAKPTREERTLVNSKTGVPFKMDITIRYDIDRLAIPHFVQAFYNVNGTKPTREEIEEFKELIVNGMPLLATYGGKHPEICDVSDVCFEENNMI